MRDTKPFSMEPEVSVLDTFYECARHWYKTLPAGVRGTYVGFFTHLVHEADKQRRADLGAEE